MPPAARPLIALLAVSLALPAPASGQAAGAVIEGRLAVGPGPLKKTVSRYPSGVVGAREMQPIPAVVYLVGEGLEASPPSGATVDVSQRDTTFMPSAIAIQTGTVVRFPNEDPFFHNVFSYARNARFDLGRYPEGDSRQVAFDAPGIARVFCEVHQFMRAVVVVTDHPFHAVVGEDGSFRITGVPPGEHTLVAYHPDLGSSEHGVLARAGRTETLEIALGG